MEESRRVRTLSFSLCLLLFFCVGRPFALSALTAACTVLPPVLCDMLPPLLSGLYLLLSFLLSGILYCALIHTELHLFELFPRTLPKRYGIAALFSFAALLAAETVVSLLRRLFEAVGAAVPAIDPPTSILSAVGMFFSLVLIPAVAEECFFRGCVLRALRPFGLPAALIGSTAAFALYHADFSLLPLTLTAGLIFGFFTAESGSLWFSVLLHALWNTREFLLLAFPSAARLRIPADTCILLVGLLIALAMLLRRIAVWRLPAGETPPVPFRADASVFLFLLLAAARILARAVGIL